MVGCIHLPVEYHGMPVERVDRIVDARVIVSWRLPTNASTYDAPRAFFQVYGPNECNIGPKGCNIDYQVRG